MEAAISTNIPDLLLCGDKAGLGTYAEKHVDTYWRQEQNLATLVAFGRPAPETRESRMEVYRHQAQNTVNARFTVYDIDPQLTDPRPVGTTALLIDEYHRVGEFVIQIAPDARGRGLGTEATWLTLDWGFHVSNLASIWLSVKEPHVGAIRAYEKAGFRHAGMLRDAAYWGGRRCGEVHMDILPGEFQGPSAVLSLLPGAAPSMTGREENG